jgi:hypothetical protein
MVRDVPDMSRGRQCLASFRDGEGKLDPLQPRECRAAIRGDHGIRQFRGFFIRRSLRGRRECDESNQPLSGETHGATFA